VPSPEDGAKARARGREINGLMEAIADRRLLRAGRGAPNRTREWIDLHFRTIFAVDQPSPPAFVHGRIRGSHSLPRRNTNENWNVASTWTRCLVAARAIASNLLAPSLQ